MKLRNLLPAMLVVVACAIFPTASSADAVYYHGNYTTNLYWPACSGSYCDGYSTPFASKVTESAAATVNGATVCASTLDTAVVCSGSLAKKYLCGCQMRYADSRGTFNQAPPRGRAQVVYNN